jgi:tRNA-modifying protein YgfZ
MTTDPRLAPISAPQIATGRYALAHLGVIEASGEQAAAFLQNMLSQDVVLQPVRTVRLASMCSPKGRMLVSGWVVKLAADRFAWIVSRDLVAQTAKRLKMFQLRMKLTLKDATADYSLVGEISAGALASTSLPASLHADGCWSASLPAVQGLPRQIHALPDASSHESLQNPSPWLLAEVLSGIAQVHAATAEAFVPQMLNHESVDGVSFKKGCYPGQEVVARSQFRGAIKRRAAIFFASGANLAAGQALEQALADGPQEVGLIAQTASTAQGTWLIASVQTAAMGVGAESISAQGAALTPLALPYPLRDDL